VEPDLHSYDDDPRSRYASSVDEDEARVLIDAGAAARAAMVPWLRQGATAWLAAEP